MDDKIEFSCVHCGAKYKVSADISGKQVNCKNCGKKFIAPIPDDLSVISQKTELENSSNTCNQDAPPQQPNEQQPERKACPFCGEQILSVAKKCRYCGEFLDDKDRHSDRFVGTEIKYNPKLYSEKEKPKKGNGGWIGLALIIAAGWFFGRYIIMYMTGTTLDFKDVNISYHSPVTEHEAKKLAEFYSSQRTNPISILLTRTENTYQIRYSLKKGTEHIVDNIFVYGAFKDEADKLSSVVFNGKRVELHLCNDWMWTKRMISGQSNPVTTSDPNSQFVSSIPSHEKLPDDIKQFNSEYNQKLLDSKITTSDEININGNSPKQQLSDDITFFGVDVPQEVKDVFMESKRLNLLLEQLYNSLAELSKTYQPTNEKIISKQNEIEKVKSDLEQLMPNIRNAVQEWLKTLDEKIFIKEQEYAEIIKEYLPTSQQAQNISQEISRLNTTRNRAVAFTYINQENSIGMKLIYIRPGEFMMGSNDDERYEKPVHKVEITKGFWMGQFEITQSQYEAVMGKNPSYSKGDNLPVENVSWNDAMDFCKKLSEKSGSTYTLPTEAQWEYACRGGTTTRYSFGDKESSLGDYAWYHSNSGGKTHPVGQKEPNPWGFYDMHGNVWEWCLDYYDENFYSKGEKQDPVNLQSSSDRILRGGSWGYGPSYCQSACRNWSHPGISLNNGFRVVWVP